MYIGMRESEARALITQTMSVTGLTNAGGLKNAGALTLFGGNDQPLFQTLYPED